MLEDYLEEQPIATKLLLNSYGNNKIVQAYLFISNDKIFLMDYAIAFSKKLIGVSDSNGDVPLILWGNGAPTSSTAGQPKQLYFNQSSGIMYICTGESGGTYSWASMGITVDNVLSSSSSNPVANAVLTSFV